ncbi:MAG: M42 family peptidase [Ruminococcus sp.]|jgi:putative aminopeptidase FrvX|nr:M42 family peptidase [Ruminococcus sp.]MEE0186981.1 M42 family peptidase [Oscillospiraceae bacterium]
MSLELKNVIFDLSSADGVSGEESCAAQYALKYLKNYTDDCFIKNGNVIGNFGNRKNGTPHILIDAHIDQVGLIVTNIYESGFIGFSNVGGIDRRLLPAQQVCIHGKKKLAGVVCSTPPHLSGSDNKINKIEDFYIDTGMSFEAVSNIVEPGDRITFASMPKELLNDRITGPALDDRSGVASILYALELLRNQKYECSFSVTFSAQEELGERGAKIAAFDIDPDIALAVDVSFAYCLGDREYECGKMGQGPMIGISPSLSREISDKLIEISKNENIPYQLEVMNGLTSTNADQFSVNRTGCKACTVSIPLKYMHTPSEIIQIDDVENTGRLIAAYIRSVSNV